MKPHISCCVILNSYIFQFHYLFQRPSKMKNAKSNKSLTPKILFHSKISQIKYWKNKNVDHCLINRNKEQKTCYGEKTNFRKSKNKHNFFFFSNGDQEILKYVYKDFIPITILIPMKTPITFRSSRPEIFWYIKKIKFLENFVKKSYIKKLYILF